MSNFPNYKTIILGRNQSWINSLWLAWVVTPLQFPDALWETFKGPLFDLVNGVIQIIIVLPIWVIARVIVLIMGLFGMVRQIEMASGKE